MSDDRTGDLAKLRVPFPANQVNVLPKPYQKDAPKSFCQVCKTSHGQPAAHLDYVGHAALTDRFLDVDPLWSWEPLAVGPNGLPVFDQDGGLWIRLTLCGVTRLGYGDAQGKRGGNAVKEAIGDALRNAGMRFGAALDLWHRGELHQEDEAPAQRPEPVREPKPPVIDWQGLYKAAMGNRDKLTAVRNQAKQAGVPEAHPLFGAIEQELQKIAAAEQDDALEGRLVA